MSDWQEIVIAEHGENEQSRKFILEVEGHLINYESLKVYFRDKPSLAQTKREAEKVQSYTKELLKYSELLGEKLAGTNYGLISLLTVGLLRDSSNNIDGRDTLQFLDDIKIELAGAARNIEILCNGAGAALDSIDGDSRYEDARYHNTSARKTLVKSICTSYENCFDFPANSGNPSFHSVLESILDPIGITTTNLPRLLNESK